MINLIDHHTPSLPMVPYTRTLPVAWTTFGLPLISLGSGRRSLIETMNIPTNKNQSPVKPVHTNLFFGSTTNVEDKDYDDDIEDNHNHADDAHKVGQTRKKKTTTLAEDHVPK